MNKKVLGIALLAASIFGFNGMAQTPVSSDAPVCKQQVCKKKGDKHKAGNKGRMGKHDPFCGIELTEQQKSELVKLRESRKADLKAYSAEARKDRRMCDSTLRVKRMEAKKSYLLEVKRILGNDKYVTFLENSYLSGNHANKEFRKGDAGRKARFGKEKKERRKEGRKDRKNG